MPHFRTAALNARQSKWMGGIILVRPISFTFLTAGTAICAAIVVTFLTFGSYTKRSTISGQLLPASGLVKVYVPQPGIVAEKHVTEGQPITTGDVLYVLSSERQSSTQGAIQAAISEQVEARQRSMRGELEKTRLLHKDERDAISKKIASLQAESAKLDGQIEVQRSRAKLAEETLARYQGLLTEDYISREQLQQKQEDLLDQKNRLQSLERERISISRELGAQQNELSGLGLKHENQLAQIERAIASAEQELTESEAKRRLVITAPESGTATAVIAEVGQAADTSKPLVSIVPAGTTLQAQLYAPSKAIGFVKPGDVVMLRYQAYPYQKFGHARGTVAAVARTALSGSEFAGTANFSGNAMASNSEPLYRITVDLESQSINAYGKKQMLQAGMLVDADVLQDTRRLYEWVLEPLYSLTGKL